MKKYLSIGFMSVLVFGGLVVANKANATVAPGPTVGTILITPSVVKDEVLYIGKLTSISAPIEDTTGFGIDPTSCVYVIDGGSTSGTPVPDAYVDSNCVFTDLDTSAAHGSLNVKVRDLEGGTGLGRWTVFTLDITPPEIAPHDKITVETVATSANISTGVAVDYTAPDATDNVDATAPATCLPASGSIFPFGITNVKCNKTDTLGNVATETNFDIKVQDTIDPIIVQADGAYSIKKTGPNTIEVLFDGELQNNPSGHHPSASDFYAYNDLDSSEDFSGGDVSYGIIDDAVSYSNSTHTVFINLTNSINAGDKPRLLVADTRASLVDFANNYFNDGNWFDQPVIDPTPRGGGALMSYPEQTPPPVAPVDQTPPPVTEQPALPPTSGEVLGAETYQFTRTLRRGMKGDDVLELHKKLTELGFYKGVIDDIFGRELEKAVKEYQKANPPLKIDGIVGPKTRAVLNK
ncbi:MAG: peptidoglycan-binding protein [Candidatus Paceibacterota bacterium]|jgi:hypothetical protein